MNKSQCPDCGSFDTERVHTEWYQDMVEEVRICNDSETQFTNQFSLFGQEIDELD